MKSHLLLEPGDEAWTFYDPEPWLHRKADRVWVKIDGRQDNVRGSNTGILYRIRSLDGTESGESKRRITSGTWADACWFDPDLMNLKSELRACARGG